jgi:hypothetical protein
LQTAILLELRDGALRALAPDPVDPARVEAHTTQPVLDGTDRRRPERIGWGSRRRDSDLLGTQKEPGVNAKGRDGRLIQLAGRLQLVVGLKLLQSGDAVRSPHSVDGPVVSTGMAQLVLNRLDGGWRHGLDVGQRCDGLTDSGMAKWSCQNCAGGKYREGFHVAHRVLWGRQRLRAQPVSLTPRRRTISF